MALATSALPNVHTATYEGQSVEWWLRRLHARLLARRPGLEVVRKYYKGDFQWRYGDRKLRRAFGNAFYQSRLGVNWMRLVIVSQRQRLRIDGIRIGESRDADPAAWKMWQAARMDARCMRAHHMTLLYGACCVTPWPGNDPDTPLIHIDNPVSAAVELDPDDELQRMAGLRTYLDVAGVMHAQLFFPDAVYLFRSQGAVVGSSPLVEDAARMTWLVDTADEPDGVIDNPYDVVPVVPFYNNDSSEWPGEEDNRWLQERSELHGVMPIQDALNSVLMNTLLVVNKQGYRQRWVTGLEVKSDEKGREIEPFPDADISRIFQAENKDTKFGDFAETDPAGLIAVIDQLVRQLAASSQIPPHIIEPQADRLSADSIRAAESGLIEKIRDKQVVFGDNWEEVLRISGRVVGNDALSQANAAEVIWKDPETHTMAALYDAALKSASIGIPWRARMEFLGYSPQQIDRMERERTEDALLNLDPDIPINEMVKASAPQPWGSPVPPTTVPEGVAQP